MWSEWKEQRAKAEAQRKSKLNFISYPSSQPPPQTSTLACMLATTFQPSADPSADRKSDRAEGEGDGEGREGGDLESPLPVEVLPPHVMLGELENVNLLGEE
jgi:hypothetical protein